MLCQRPLHTRAYSAGIVSCAHAAAAVALSVPRVRTGHDRSVLGLKSVDGRPVSPMPPMLLLP